MTSTIVQQRPVDQDRHLTPRGHLLLLLPQLLLALPLEVLLLSLGVQLRQLLVTLGLPGLLALEVALLALLLQVRLLDLLDDVLADALHLLEHLGAEVGLLDELVGDADKVLKDRQERLVVVVRGETVLEEDALPRRGLVEPGELSAANDARDLV